MIAARCINIDCVVTGLSACASSLNTEFRVRAMRFRWCVTCFIPVVWFDSLQDQCRQNAEPLRVSSLGARETEGGSGESSGNLFTVLRLNPNHLTIAWLTETLFNVIESIDCSIAHLRRLCSRMRDAQSQAALSKKDLFICPNHPINN